jgi:hypothetical protein
MKIIIEPFICSQQKFILDHHILYTTLYKYKLMEVFCAQVN